MKKRYTYQPSDDVCSTRIAFCMDENGTISDVTFEGGCDGNLKAVGKLAEGMNAQALIEKLAGNTCGDKDTSCTDQLAAAIRKALDESR